MFGYIVIHEPELRVREAALYRSYYCGLCEDLKESYGRAGQLTLSYDMTFLALLLTCLYEPSDEKTGESVCLPHPLKKHASRRSAYTRYAADMTILLSYYALKDDWEDERKFRGLMLSAALDGAFRTASARHPEKAQVIQDCLGRLHLLEKGTAASEAASSLTPASSFAPASSCAAASPSGTACPPRCATPDETGACFGELLSEIFVMEHDLWEPQLRGIGFYIGKFIYLMDAYDDLEKDRESGSFNPLLPVQARMHTEQADFDGYVRTLLTMLMASCCRAFEALPIVENVDILRNILYAGVWTRFEQVFAERTKADDKG